MKALASRKLETKQANICPDFDKDCADFTQDKAVWCFMGCQNHPCNPGVNLGVAQGYCPIIHKSQ